MPTPYDASPEHLREMILGRSGPYADPRDAIDALDNVYFWLSQCDQSLQQTALRSLLQLSRDPDITVATGAVLSLDCFTSITNQPPVLQDLIDRPEMLHRQLEGFRRDGLGSLGSQIARFVARTSNNENNSQWLRTFQLPFILPDIPSLLTHLALHRPHFVLHVARRYLSPKHTSVLIQLPRHWMRIALATQFNPWPQTSIEIIAKASQWLKWDINDWAALERVLRDDYPILTHPPGTPRNKRWWMVDGDGAEWTLWESMDQEYCIEVLQPGYAYEFRPFPISKEIVEALMLHGHSAIREQLRLWKSGKA